MRWIKRLIFLLFAFLLLVFIHHRYRLGQEKKGLRPPGQMLEVNGHHLHLYRQGQGKQTLVFLTGAGTPSPVLDFKPLYKDLAKNYQIVVIEPFGYGFSDVVSGKRTVKKKLEETRKALKKAGIKGPFVLVPHSMSGITALAWLQAYPKEVTSIIGLDMSLPNAYKDLEVNHLLLNLGQWATRIGLTRLMPKDSLSSVFMTGALSKEEEVAYLALSHAKLLNKTMIAESQSIKEEAAKVDEKPIPQIPILLFSSNGQGTGFDKETWQTYQKEFVAQFNHGKLVILDAPHYVHHYASQQIIKQIDNFLDGLSQIN